jgi:hypothetical protein
MVTDGSRTNSSEGITPLGYELSSAFYQSPLIMTIQSYKENNKNMSPLPEQVPYQSGLQCYMHVQPLGE